MTVSMTAWNIFLLKPLLMYRRYQFHFQTILWDDLGMGLLSIPRSFFEVIWEWCLVVGEQGAHSTPLNSSCLHGRYKLMKFWAQSFLVGVPRIVVGFRDDEGTVNSLQTFKTTDIPNETQVCSHMLQACPLLASSFFPPLPRMTSACGSLQCASTF